MKTILSFLFVFTMFVANAQTKNLSVIMTDSTHFKYPAKSTLGDAKDSNLVVYGNMVNNCKTKINFNFDNKVMFITYPNGVNVKNKIITYNDKYGQINCDILTESGMFYNFVIAENISGEMSMIVRSRHKTKDGHVEGYFTNNVTVIK
jgi:hypothetical protein